MDNKAQGALEYLLILAGALLVAVIVVSLLGELAGQGKNVANNQMNRLENLVE